MAYDLRSLRLTYRPEPADGVVEFRMPIPSRQVAQWTDPSYDMGRFAERKSHTRP